MSEESRNERRVLVAVDESDESMYALSWSLKNIIFQNSTDNLVLLYVKPHHGTYASAADRLDDPEAPAIRKYSQDVADCVIEKSKRLCKNLQNVKVETHIGSGDPREVICEMTEKLNADLLVMGSHGHGLIKSIFLGSVSNHCSQKVKCPVLIVKKPKPCAGAEK
ncbi:hypothetical protein PHAVU_001G225300 [Phaseolus vulgaris]